jgi:ribosomal protein L11 methylase PrmA
MVSPDTLNKKGWFIAGGREGDRTLEQQMTGLDRLLSEVQGKTVLDAGCAEGLISIELTRHGAVKCHGLEIVPGHVEVANELAEEAQVPCTFEVANLNQYDLGEADEADIVLMLAILHKLRDPSKVCAALAGKAKELCVIRLTPEGPVIVDERSNRVPHHIAKVMDECGFRLEAVEVGPLREWVGYFRRNREASSEMP